MYHYNYPASPSLHSKMVSQHFKAFVNVFSMKHHLEPCQYRTSKSCNHVTDNLYVQQIKCVLAWLLNDGDCVIVYCYECDALRFAVISDAVISMCLSSPVSRLRLSIRCFCVLYAAAGFDTLGFAAASLHTSGGHFRRAASEEPGVPRSTGRRLGPTTTTEIQCWQHILALVQNPVRYSTKWYEKNIMIKSRKCRLLMNFHFS